MFQIGKGPSGNINSSHYSFTVVCKLVGIVATFNDVLAQVLLLLLDRLHQVL